MFNPLYYMFNNRYCMIRKIPYTRHHKCIPIALITHPNLQKNCEGLKNVQACWAFLSYPQHKFRKEFYRNIYPVLDESLIINNPNNSLLFNNPKKLIIGRLFVNIFNQ